MVLTLADTLIDPCPVEDLVLSLSEFRDPRIDRVLAKLKPGEREVADFYAGHDGMTWDLAAKAAGQPPAFGTLAELEAFFRQVYAPYGWLPDPQWRHLTETSARRLPDGRWTTHYDPQMVRQFTDHADDYRTWEHYDALALPVLLLRGAQSDLVLPETAEAMRLRGPGARGLLQVQEVAGCGHAPALNVPAQFATVDAFLTA